MSDDLQATFKRLELEQKLDEGQGLCGYAEKMLGCFFVFTRKCKLDGTSCSNFNKVDLVASCPTLRKWAKDHANREDKSD